jgi:two-component sensor histidine kinase
MAEQSKPGTAPYSLHEPLPADVVVRSSGRIASYRNYPVFSAPWFWRRTLVFGSGAVIMAVVQAVSAWRVLDAKTFAVLVCYAIVIWLAIVTAGPALATFVRTRGWSSKRERIGIVVAFFVGLAVSCFVQWLALWLDAHYIVPQALKLGTIPKGPHRPSFAPPMLAFYGVWLLALFSVLGGAFAVRAYFDEQKRWRENQREREIEALRRQKSEVDMKLTVLQAQVEPHFLFNALASVHSLVRQDPRRAEATIEALVDHLRATLPKLRAGVGVQHSTLNEQLEVSASYLAVMQVRMGERLHFQLDVPAHLRMHPFPPLLLISLVENAIKHGVEPKPAGGIITISATERTAPEGDQLAVSVVDNGVGLRPGLGDGVGLANVRAQLASQFGSRGQLAIQSRAAGGVAATLLVPLEAEIP